MSDTKRIAQRHGYVDHKSSCNGATVCVKCGRRGCPVCIFDRGMCVVCTGKWDERDISLFTVGSGDWDDETN